MAGITDAVGSLVQSIVDIFTSIIRTIGNVFNSLFSVGSTIIGETAVLSKDVVNLIFGNIVIIGIGMAGFVAFSAYQQRRGNDTATKARKKLQ